jgi:hypothetical protein
MAGDPAGKSIRLNLGCGRKKLDNAINVDISPAVGPEIVHNLDIFPWPFLSETFVETLAYDNNEHCADIVKTMEEIHRVSRNGAVVKLTVPHFSSVNAFTDPSHRHFFSASSFRYFAETDDLSFYSAVRYRSLVRQIIFAPTLANRLVHRLANRWKDEYERRWAWIFPAWFIYFELEVIKKKVGD